MRNLVTVSMDELDRLKCIEAVIDGTWKLAKAAERLGLTSRQVWRHTRVYIDATARLDWCPDAAASQATTAWTPV